LPPVTKISLFSLLTLSSFTLYLKIHILNNAQHQQSDQNEIKSVNDIFIPFFELIPSSVIKNPWVLVLSTFVESTFLGGLINALNIMISFKYFERIWGGKELLKFNLIISFFTNLFTSLIVISLTLLISNSSDDSNNILNKNYGGVFTLLLSYLVSFKQLIPEHNLVFFKGLIFVRIKHLPFVVLNLLIIVSIINKSYYPGLNSIFSFFFSWFYLRFHQSIILDPLLPTNNTGNTQSFGVRKIKGDASDTFAFIHFFPIVLQPILSPILNLIYQLSIRLGLISQFTDDLIQQSNDLALKRINGQSSLSNSVFSTNNNNANHKNTSKSSEAQEIAERRRQVALKLMQERFN
ncbi:uncharacterized protein ASCRUDRAFT_23956, partial [Ascoidea rubescens DSM 1968]